MKIVVENGDIDKKVDNLSGHRDRNGVRAK